MTFPKFSHRFKSIAISFSSELILHLHCSGDGGGGVYGGGGGSFWSSKCMFLILSVNQPAEINYMINKALI